MPEVVNRAQELETEKESPIDSNNDQSPPLTLKRPTKAALKKIQRIFHFKWAIREWNPYLVELSEENPINSSEPRKIETNNETQLPESTSNQDLNDGQGDEEIIEKHSLQQQQYKSQLDGSIDCFYQALLEWLLHKMPNDLEATVFIDDTDQITSSSILELIIGLYTISEELAKQRVSFRH